MVDAQAAPGDAAGGEAVAPVTAGALLRAARERQGVHLAVLAASLKVAPRKLELLEAGRYDELPDASFARALALSMCRALKIDPQAVLAGLPNAQGERLEHLTRSLNQPFRESEGRRDGGESRRWSLPLVAAALLVVGAVVVYLLPARLWTPAEVTPDLVPGPGSGAAAPTRGTEAAPVGAPAVADPAAADPAAAQASVAAASVAAPGGAASSVVLDTVFLAPPAEAASAEAQAAAADVLSLNASAPSWVEVRDAKNQVVFSRTLGAGETAGVNGTPPLRLTIGNAAATRVSFRGEPVDLKATRDNVARIELK